MNRAIASMTLHLAVAAACFWQLPGVAHAQSLDLNLLKQKQAAQQRARGMARELVTSILDLQLEQLADNGLQELPLYRDIRGMRSNIDGLVEAEMLAVVELLVAAQDAAPQEQQAAFVAAREKIREIVIRLSIERQNLSRRLQAAEIAAQVKRLIGMQTVVHNTTRTIGELPKSRQEATILSTAQDQRDIKQLFFQLVETLSDVRTWGGAVGDGAADGLAILHTAAVGKELDSAGQTLETTALADAAGHQQRVIKGLRLLLEKIEETQGLIGADRAATMEQVRELIKQQDQLRTTTRQTALTDEAVDPLVEKQTGIQQQLARLTEALQEVPAAIPLLEQAQAAAYEATGDLFDTEQQQALAQQDKVLANLAEISEHLATANEMDTANRSAEQFAQLAAELARTQQDLEQVAAQQQHANSAVAPDPRAAAALEQQISNKLAQVQAERNLPVAVESRLAQAAEAARGAAQASETAQQQQAVEQADEALERATAEVAAALADTERRQLAVQVGELARAAEVLERAAAAEREISQQAGELAEQKPSTTTAAQLAADQAEVQAVVEKLAAGLEKISPTAAATVAATKPPLAAASQELSTLEKASGSASQSAVNNAAKSASTQAASAAHGLATAAQQTRGDIAELAKQLAKLSGEQLANVSAANDAVGATIAEQPPAVAEQIHKLDAAAAQLREAATEQLRAAGRPAAAAAQEFANQVASARDQQAAADRAAEQLAAGKANTALDALSAQQQAAERAGELAERATKAPPSQDGQPKVDNSALEAALRAAQDSADEAARATMDGNVSQAEAARAVARSAFQQAAELSAASAARAAEASAGPPSAEHQQQVTEKIDTAKQLAADLAPSLGEQLEAARDASQQATKTANAGDRASTDTAQAEVAAALDAAQEQLAELKQQTAQQAQNQLATAATQAGKLATETAKVDPAALAALRAGEATAEKAAAAVAAEPGLAQHAEQGLAQALDRAAANLTAREDRLRRDQAVAQAMAELAEQQSAAADEIMKGREELSRTADDPVADAKTAPPTMTPEQTAAARMLKSAAERFAATQRATGEGATEISGQREVANPPLREALDLAAGLLNEQLPQLPTSDDQRPPMLADSDDTDAADSDQIATPDAADQVASSDPTDDGASEQAAARSTPRPTQQPGSPSTPSSPSGSAGQPIPRAGMGQDFTPRSPEITAQLMAGPAAMAQLAAAKSLPEFTTEEATTADSQPTNALSPSKRQERQADQQRGTASQMGNVSNSQRKSSSPRNGDRNDSLDIKEPSDNAADGVEQPGADADATARDFQSQPWFAKLPPELRKAMNAESRRPPPRGYEERLKRYFENVD